MSEIKSEKAKRILQAHYVGGDDNPHSLFLDGLRAVEIAETEAEERHAKEMQELKDRAVETFRRCCKYKHDWFCSDLDNRTENGECDSNCNYMQNFTQKLNKQ